MVLWSSWFSIMWGLISVLWMPIFYEHIQIFVETGSFDKITQVAPNTLCNVYAMIGGSGSTLALVVLLLVLGKKVLLRDRLERFQLFLVYLGLMNL